MGITFAYTADRLNHLIKEERVSLERNCGAATEEK